MKRKKVGLKPTAKRGRPPRDSTEQDGSSSNNLGPEQRLNQDLLNLAAMNELNVLHMLQQAFAQTQSLEAEKKRREREEEEAAAAKKSEGSQGKGSEAATNGTTERTRSTTKERVADDGRD